MRLYRSLHRNAMSFCTLYYDKILRMDELLHNVMCAIHASHNVAIHTHTPSSQQLQRIIIIIISHRSSVGIYCTLKYEYVCVRVCERDGERGGGEARIGLSLIFG